MDKKYLKSSERERDVPVVQRGQINSMSEAKTTATVRPMTAAHILALRAVAARYRTGRGNWDHEAHCSTEGSLLAFGQAHVVRDLTGIAGNRR